MRLHPHLHRPSAVPCIPSPSTTFRPILLSGRPYRWCSTQQQSPEHFLTADLTLQSVFLHCHTFEQVNVELPPADLAAPSDLEEALDLLKRILSSKDSYSDSMEDQLEELNKIFKCMLASQLNIL